MQNLITRKSYSTTMAISTLKKLIGKRYLQCGDGILSMPACRRRQRLFGENGTGRTSRASLGVKIEKLMESSPEEDSEDSCLKAFVRAIAGHAAQDTTAHDAGA